MTLLFLHDVPGLASAFQIVEVDDQRALNELLPKRLAMVATARVRSLTSR